jgi:hypothetical protein
VKTLPKNLIVRLSRAGSQQQDEVRPYRTRGAGDGDAKRKQQNRGGEGEPQAVIVAGLRLIVKV